MEQLTMSRIATRGEVNPETIRYYEREGLIAASFPANDDRDLLRRMIDESVDDDRFGMQSHRKGTTVLLSYPSVILSSQRLS